MTNEAPPSRPEAGDTDAKFREAVRLHGIGQLDEAECLYRAVLAESPVHPQSLLNLGLIMKARGRYEVALSLWRTSVLNNPDEAAAHVAAGKVLAMLGRVAEAVRAFEAALKIRPRDADALNCRGNALARLGLHSEALASYDQALTVDPDYGLAVVNRANILGANGRSEEAVAAYKHGLRLGQKNPELLGAKLHQQLQNCDWSDYSEATAEIVRHIEAGEPADLPFPLLAHCDDPSVQLLNARNHVRQRFPILPAHLWTGEIYRHERIRVAYVSADFFNHATVHLMAELFERHDPERFQMAAYALGPRIEDAERARVRAAFPEFHDVADLSDLEVARMLRASETDIVVDLKGFTTHCRPGIFAHRAAPIQMNYLGYPGTMGADFIDYIIADHIVIPAGSDRFYSEQVIRLPHSYQVNGRSRGAVGRAPTRHEAELPQDAFVFASFNASYKFNPPMFDCWMRLLQRVPGSVLWLLAPGPSAITNLRAEAARRGVSPDRLIFAPRLASQDHLARHGLADLFLDTLPCNAHTTASDALWAGLPVVTCAGRGLVARVAASLLTAVGLTELITNELEAYEALALDLALNPERLAAVKADLRARVGTAPLFDIDLTRRHIEAAYIAAWERQRRGEPPAAFDVPA